MLTTAQSQAYTRIMQPSSSAQDVRLSDDHFRALVHIAARDLQLEEVVGEPLTKVPELYSSDFDLGYVLPGDHPKDLFEKIISSNPEADTYLACLAALHKRRLKYQKILSTQPFATMDQIAPRGLLQYMQLDTAALSAFLVWRKWMFDIDNRAAQDTGYMFEPVIAGAIGGIPCAAKNSPVLRSTGKGGRQVDCIKDDKAYEIKLRITIAASGQGRWSQELSFPLEAQASGYTPILVVLDPTPSSKLDELIQAFHSSGGRSYIGEDAWSHLEEEAGVEMAHFLEKYIRQPLEDVYDNLKETDFLPPLKLSNDREGITVAVGEQSWTIDRGKPDSSLIQEDPMPEDAAKFLPGVEA